MKTLVIVLGIIIVALILVLFLVPAEEGDKNLLDSETVVAS